MRQIRFVDTTLRDGQQSLWAYGMRTGMIVPIAKHMDDAGFEAIELGGPVELPKCVRELREDPWERYRLVSSRITKTPLRVIHGTRSGFSIYPHAIHQLYDRCMADIGVKQVAYFGLLERPGRLAMAGETGACRGTRADH